jgi:DNA-binding HxlR family transcriptional regulator
MVEDVLGCKWSMHVLMLVESGVRRPGAMERAVEGLTAKVLNERLTKLTRYGILTRTTFPEVPPRVEYDLTTFGRRFSTILADIRGLPATIDATSRVDPADDVPRNHERS